MLGLGWKEVEARGPAGVTHSLSQPISQCYTGVYARDENTFPESPILGFIFGMTIDSMFCDPESVS